MHTKRAADQMSLSCRLFGITCVQAYAYFTNCTNDHGFLRFMVSQFLTFKMAVTRVSVG